ncbi:MAG: CpsD/CapB family tyrosine-protein kinase [Syntrophobacteraceae bacterium]|jgi:capsular exopolysaccharide synthesis family protein
MSKIYEALQVVHRQEKGEEAPPAELVPCAPPEPDGFGLEEEMLSLYKIVVTLLPKVQSRIIQFIGAREGEGTSTIIREFAKVSADLIGHSVLLLDADRYQPSQNRFFDIPKNFGWLDALKSGGNVADACHRVGQSKLFVSTSSNSAAPTPEIFNDKFDCMCQNLRKDFELVLIDSAPLTVSPDGLAIASKVDGVVLVVEAEKTRWQTVRAARNSISSVGGSILGVVLNKRRYYIPQSIYKYL